MVNHTYDHCMRQVFKWVTLLVNDHDVPVLVTLNDRKNVQVTHGSKKVVAKFKTSYDSDPSWKLLFTEDHDDQRVANQRYLNIDSDLAYEQVLAARPPEKLPFPLNLMSFDEKSEVAFNYPRSVF